ncbi:MAG: YIP1 family protein [Eubacteriales bacterium]|nr:YIP1 family protein [Eubacteriales bacterium]MDD3880992.1 YIP1 family protein [Eubacteriales bacterium]MDD4511939.1 YIP1 family protein [Eubacteriales bacterium]
MKKRAAALLFLLLMLPSIALASTPYRTFTQSKLGDLVETQTAYEPVRSMLAFGDERLKTPSDMRLAPDGNLYICDTGNKRILVITTDGEFVKEIGDKKTLKSPKGVFVTDNLDVYVADENGRAVVVFDKDGKVINEYEKPTHPLFGETSPYKPNKVVVDKRGNLYVNSTGNTNGLVQLSPGEAGGEFLGYFGANTTIVSFLTRIRKAIFSDDQLTRTAGIVPTSINNMAIDDKGMIYAISTTGDFSSIRKLNVAGKNILEPNWWVTSPTAVTTSPTGNIFVTDSSGYIFEYTSEGKLLFIFGSYDDGQQRNGLFLSVTGIAVDESENVYVLDEKTNSIQVFKPTEFCSLVHRAFNLFMNGRYAESKEPWREILRMNSLFSYASIGYGEALYREGDFEGALAAFRNGGNYQGYSDAYWEIRSNWLHSYIGLAIIIVVCLVLLRVIIKLIDKKTGFLSPIRRAGKAAGRVPILRQLSYSFTILRNPADCMYGVLREKRASLWSAAVMMALYFVFSLLCKYSAGFLFKNVPDGYYNLLGDFTEVFGIYLLFSVCCYLVSTITEGEATAKSILIGVSYALLPVIIAMPIKLFLTNVLTYNESVFISLIDFASYGWSAVLILLTIKYLNDYTFKKTLWTIVLTAFTALIAVALLFVAYVLISQLCDFIASIYGEVVYRFVKA